MSRRGHGPGSAHVRLSPRSRKRLRSVAALRTEFCWLTSHLLTASLCAASACLFQCCVSMGHKPRLVSCLISRVRPCSSFQGAAETQPRACPQHQGSLTQPCEAGLRRRRALIPDTGPGGCLGPTPRVASTSRGHERLCLPSEVVGDKQGPQRPVINLFLADPGPPELRGLPEACVPTESQEMAAFEISPSPWGHTAMRCRLLQRKRYFRAWPGGHVLVFPESTVLTADPHSGRLWPTGIFSPYRCPSKKLQMPPPGDALTQPWRDRCAFLRVVWLGTLTPTTSTGLTPSRQCQHLPVSTGLRLLHCNSTLPFVLRGRDAFVLLRGRS